MSDPDRIEGVALLLDGGAGKSNAHDRTCREALVRRVAALVGAPALSPVEAAAAVGRSLLLVPGETLDAQAAAVAGVTERGQILGGVVPEMFVGTKSISHGLVDADAARPAAWSSLMGELVDGCVLAGFTAFGVEDARRAGLRLLQDGPVRIKDVCGKAGLGQTVVRSPAELDAALALEQPAELARCGLVLEEDLTDVVTYSVGAVTLGEETISYWGVQTLTRDHHGREVYGGSDLFAVRGDLPALLEAGLAPRVAEAVRAAICFDRAAHRAYPGVLLTRRNYDVIEGLDAQGRRRTGVLEQSWRIGGASGAEIAALEAFRAEPDTREVRASTVEVYGDVIPPDGAVVYWRGEDPRVGAMTKFTVRHG